MKLVEIANALVTDKIKDLAGLINREESTPELAELLSYKGVKLFACNLLSDDERELALLIANKLDQSLHYVPSMSVLQFVRAINAKLAICGSSQSASC